MEAKGVASTTFLGQPAILDVMAAISDVFTVPLSVLRSYLMLSLTVNPRGVLFTTAARIIFPSISRARTENKLYLPH
jgi:hypothetical protein